VLSRRHLNAICLAAPVADQGTNTDIPQLLAGALIFSARAWMDILAGMLAYIAGLGVLFAAFALAFMFVATPKASLQTRAQPQSANAMLVRRMHKPTRLVEARVKESTHRSEKHAAATGSRDSAQRTASSRDTRRNRAASAAQARRSTEEEHARRWAYQQDGNFASRFLGYSE
jgi:type IV secretory pathway TrbD component